MIDLYPHKGVSTVHPEWREACFKAWKHVRYGKAIHIVKNTLKTLINKYKVPNYIDFLTIDTEGHDLYVLKGMDWDHSRPELVCCEVMDMVHPERRLKKGRWKPSDELLFYMDEVGYVCAKLTRGGNALFIRKRND